MSAGSDSISTPPLTVLMAFHNDAPYIAAAIDSVLNQTWNDFELVLVNDASTDGSRDIVARYTDRRIRVLDNSQNLRLARSLNRGLDAARGELVARLDANDIAALDRLEKQMRFMREHPDFALVGGQYTVIDTQGRPIRNAALMRPVTELGVKWYLLFDSPFVHSTVMFRKRCVDEVGKYNPALARAQDVELWARMAVRYRMVNLRDVLVSQRYDPTSITYDRSSANRAEFLPWLSAFLAANMRRYLALDDAQAWAATMSALFFDDTPAAMETVKLYLDAVEAIEKRFVALYPDGASNRDVRRGKVQLLARALFRMTLQSRCASLPVFARMLRADAPTALRRLPKYAALGLLGSHARTVWRRWRGWRREEPV